MANKLRSVNTKFWDDSFTSELTPTEKLLFLYLITNPLTKLVGIYEISLKRICFDTGMNLKTVQDGLKRFETVRKAFFMDNYIILPNWLKHQNLNSNMKKAVIKEFDSLPNWLKDRIISNDSETVPNDYETILNHLQTVRKEEVEDEREEEYKKEGDDTISLSDALKMTFFPKSSQLDEAFKDYLKLRSKHKFTMTERAINSLVKKLRELSGGEVKKALDIIDAAIVGKWKTFYTLDK